ncbi:testis-expressed protein 264 homolog isoform X1 [Eriocheir sinensis]|uniref:testis-expressed protein 264 homolog isoform X1 n=1 Tax=Eriocheir sinensis TaxID=95602 RepID=UPI0021C6676E|nr:testis-expressed protein 264 homolog isoform X1 [Eriocheir sinensis]XP_050729243.1 testis-expressed protein 264 homolog isoform X1 [Eriocheir sinensis]XP_050729244.1 testis-expressed protein 264 homolog isoform X1 [Eriocheir sinensis]XP_050729245.1 testis-expressed protein 264 homolog isoform X1 [Eriocheir sinensis]XP_050729246.1 testis-expressed protein 264 homolog isoform X1 [Eriocheir sinensis]XP_050729247.1 testis-expressed protein 264 homolog isoform X1 [Eriocheir sinensis]XP_05072924
MDTETALLWGFLVLLLLVLATVVFLLVHSGLFISVVVKTCKPDIGEVQIAYKFARGPYKESGALFTQVHTLLPEYRTLGVYYDDPKVRQPQKLRYIVGIILGEGPDVTVVPEHRQLLEENGYQFATFPAIDHAVQTSFPFNSTVSIIVAVMKVYPALREYIEARSLCARPFLEVYDNKRSEILFIGPLARQDDFYVPEVLQEEEDYRQDDYDDDARTDNSSRSWDESASFMREGGRDGDERGGDSDGSDLDDNTSTPAYPPPPPLPTLSPTPTLHPPSPHPTPSPASSYFSTSTPPPPPLSAPHHPSCPPPPPCPPPVPEDTTTTTTTPAPATATATTTTPAPPPTTTTTATTTPLLPPPAPEVVDVDIGDTGSAGSEESDANTASSFEEIDEREAAAAAVAAATAAAAAAAAQTATAEAAGSAEGGGEAREGSVRKDDDEGER